MANLQHSFDKAAGRRHLRKNRSARYPISRSPLWRLTSIHKLATLIGVAVEDLKSICTSPTYSRFQEKLKPDAKFGKRPRQIQEPTNATLRIHYRLAKHLDSIERPDFLHSATKRRSHVSNARAHLDSGGAVVAMDIAKFYESTSYNHVKAFFLRDLGCAPDIARFLASVCTADGHLPTGSCISPLLSYFTHRRLFAAIEAMCSARGVTMTLYVDDLTLSGSHATKTMMYEVRSLIKKQGLVTKPEKDALVCPGKAAIITGAVRDGQALRLRNRHHDAVVTLQDRIAVGELNDIVFNKLRGQIASARAVEPVAATRLVARMNRMLSGIGGAVEV